MYRARPGSRGLGAYPTDCFYDKNRPSWLPYWIDTPTESQAKLACFYGVAGNVTAQEVLNPAVSYPQPPPPILPKSPQGTAVPDSAEAANALPSDLIAQAMAQTQGQNQQFFDTLNQSLNPPSGSPNPLGLSMTAIIALGLTAGVVLLFLNSGGGRRRR